ncbi:MAG: cobalamin biosynthesis protein CobW [Cytophagales bacterium]|nr:cobalamin biosynthesis protein CobW [Cytophagales bacterium]
MGEVPSYCSNFGLPTIKLHISNLLMNTQKTPITIITGFLGSGKTTIISELLKNPSGKRIAVIVNEFGDVGIDGELIKTSCACGDEDIVELNNGCLCCTVQEEFLPAMIKLMERKTHIDHIVIETSGLALPKPLLRAVQWPDLKSLVTIDAVITVVDAVGQATGEICDRERVQRQREADDSIDHETSIEELFLDQLTCADLVIMTKTDLVDQAHLAEVRSVVSGKLRSHVKVLNALKGQLSPELIFGIEAGAEDDIESRPTLHEHHHDHHQDHDHHHDEDIQSLIATLNGQTPAEIKTRLATLIDRYEIYRVKGFINIPEKPMRMVIQGVGNRFDTYFDREWEENEERSTKLVVIGKNLDERAITEFLNRP